MFLLSSSVDMEGKFEPLMHLEDRGDKVDRGRAISASCHVENISGTSRPLDLDLKNDPPFLFKDRNRGNKTVLLQSMAFVLDKSWLPCKVVWARTWMN